MFRSQGGFIILFRPGGSEFSRQPWKWGMKLEADHAIKPLYVALLRYWEAYILPSRGRARAGAEVYGSLYRLFLEAFGPVAPWIRQFSPDPTVDEHTKYPMLVFCQSTVFCPIYIIIVTGSQNLL